MRHARRGWRRPDGPRPDTFAVSAAVGLYQPDPTGHPDIERGVSPLIISDHIVKTWLRKPFAAPTPFNP